MSGVTGLVDTLIAEKLAQRPDLLHLPPAGTVPAPDPTVSVQTVHNDVRLQSEAARERQLFGGGAPAAAATGQQTQLSSAARAIGALLAQLSSQPASLPIEGTAPLAPASPARLPHTEPVLALAQALATSMAESGLFYEAHLAAAVAGGYDFEQLAREPQARIGAPEVQTRNAAGASPPATAVPTGANRELAPAAIPVAAQRLIAQQLELLATGQFQWQGQAWPGAPLQWTVRGEKEPPGARACAAARTWSTTVCLDMPDLGRVTARLTLSGSALRARVEAGACAASRLDAAGQDLRSRLAAAGFTVSDLSIGEASA